MRGLLTLLAILWGCGVAVRLFVGFLGMLFALDAKKGGYTSTASEEAAEARRHLTRPHLWPLDAYMAVRRGWSL